MPEGRNVGAARQVRIDTWKAIARHLGRSPRTVQRWHRDYGLPVHRLGVDTGSIFAYADELDAWLKNIDLAPQNTLFDRTGSELARDPRIASFPEHSTGIVDSPCIPRSQRQRSATLVDFANRLWTCVSNQNLKLIAKAFREAVDLDPGNAAAYAGLAQALLAQGLAGIIRTPGAYIAAKAALEQALTIDADLPEVKCAASWLKLLLDKNCHGARHGFDECLIQQPPQSRALVGRALLHIAEGCPGVAASLLREFVEQHTLNAEAAAYLCWSTYLAEDSIGALNLVEESRAAGQSGPVFDVVEALASIQSEDPPSSISRIESLVADTPRHELLRAVLAYAYALNGRAQAATEILHAIAGAHSSHSSDPYGVALVLIGLNERHDAVRWLEQSYRNGSLWSLGFLSDPILYTLRDEPGYRILINRTGYAAPRRRGPVSETSTPTLSNAVLVACLGACD